jgi:pilus assembly protein Flp/PilA
MPGFGEVSFIAGVYQWSPRNDDPEATMYAKFLTLLRDERGATAIEYGLIAALIAVAIITAVGLVGTNLTSTFNSVASAL